MGRRLHGRGAPGIVGRVIRTTSIVLALSFGCTRSEPPAATQTSKVEAPIEAKTEAKVEPPKVEPPKGPMTPDPKAPIPPPPPTPKKS